MSTLLSTYEEEFRDVMKTLQDDMASLRSTLQRDAPNYKPPPATGNASRIQRGKALSATAQRLKELVSSMEFETNDVVLQLRLAAKDRVAEYKKQAFNAEKDIAKLKSDCSRADRDDLLSGVAAKGAAGPGSPAVDDETAKQRVMMAENTEKLSEGTKILKAAERAANEGVDLGNQALTGLVAQRHTINKISEKTADMEQEVNNARRILSDMHRTMIKHKAILVVIILALLLMIMLIIYIKMAGSSSSSSSTTNTQVIIVTSPPQPPPAPMTAAPGSSLTGLDG